MSELTRCYRSVLKEAKHRVGKENLAKWRPQFREMFHNQDAVVVAPMMRNMFQSDRAHADLLKKYNMGGFKDERERIRKTAAMVGLQAPKFGDELEAEIKGRGQ
ncbi:hypothetical protein PROFUN_01422 [Planoprotostelium fungivorum]|uniref:Uncharacterized protein n=1 Tax=Planoprotostelium fungivorum TaxID=1890364 RepID=A0A2P6NTA6_9EUKA|nr:hypothetical protein PROFUN_01422 [Planoprotostelium fungivorum]